MNEWEKSFDKDYQNYLEHQESSYNDRFRDKDETIFEAFSSKEADFTLDEEGKKIVEFLRSEN